MSGPFWPCGRLGTSVPWSETNSRFHEYRAFYHIEVSFTGNDRPLVKADIAALLAYPKYPQDSFFASAWAASLPSMALMWLNRCELLHLGLRVTRGRLSFRNCSATLCSSTLKTFALLTHRITVCIWHWAMFGVHPVLKKHILPRNNFSKHRTKGGLATCSCLGLSERLWSLLLSLSLDTFGLTRSA